MKLWSVCFALISTSLVAQDVTNAPPAAPVPATPAPSTEPAATTLPATTTPPPATTQPKKKAAPKKAAKHNPKPSELRTVPLVPGPAVVAANHVNVRGQAKLHSEIITRMTNGESVTVIEEITLKHSGPEEPSAWAKIALPDKVHAWVHTSYIDPTNKTVIPKKLNIRGGPGENYSVIGTLVHGDTVNEISTKGNWMEIQTANAYAFMAAQYLTQEPSALAAAAPVTAATVAETPALSEAATNAPEIAEIPGATNEMAAAGTNAAAETPAPEEPPQPRIVQHEGIVRYTTSIQAPTVFELIHPETHKPIDYLYTTSTNLDLNRYKGLHIIVTGEEGLDERWKNTPIITIHSIEVIE